MGRDRYKVIDKEKRPYFVTCTIVSWIPLFGNPKIAGIVIDSLRFLHEKQRLTIHGFVIMDNHLHLIISSAELSEEMRKFKSFTARSIIDLLMKEKMIRLLDQFRKNKLSYKQKQNYQVWQEGFHPEVILDSEMLLNKLNYIHNNPVKDGYVKEPGHWRYSSWNNYNVSEEMGILPIEIIG